MDTQSDETPDAVVLQLKWLHGFQFAGYYAAVEKGYYREEGLRIELKAGGPGIYSGEAVASGRAAFAVVSPNVLLDRFAGKPVVALAAIFQHSPLIVLARRDSRIATPAGLAGRRVAMMAGGDPEILAMLRNEGIDPAAIRIVALSGRLDDLILGRFDAQAAYITNEPQHMGKRGIAAAIIKPSDYGIDFYGDVLVTNEAEIKARPQRALAFLRATRRGWEYALAHPEELADLIIARYSPGGDREHLLYEARAMIGLINPGLVEIGHMNPGRWRHIADTYVKLGMAAPDYTLKGFLASDWMQDRDPDWRPYAIGLGVFLAATLALVGLLAMWNRQLRIAVHRQLGALRQGEERHRDVLHTAMDGFWLVDMEGRLLEVNEAYCRMSGYSAQELLAMRIPDLEAAETANGTAARIQQIMAKGEDRFESRHRRKDGSVFDVAVSVQYRPAESGRFVAFLQDITERKRAEAGRTALETQLRESQKMEAIGTLAGGIAHDFNNALATILGNVELARQDVSTNPLALESLEEIRKAGSRTRDLVQQILSFSRKQPMERKLIALAPIVEESVHLLRATLPARLTLEVQCDADVPPVLADASQIQQVLINLGTNALHAMRSGPGRIGIRLDTVMLDAAMADAYPALGAMYAKRPGGAVRIAVSDDGSGIDAATVERVFEPFFTTKPAGEGTGLGLSVVHGIVQAHEGAIVVESAPGKGTTFTLYLPAERRFELLAPEPRESAATATSDLGGGQRILYIDDDESLVFLVQRLLERRGYRISGYTDPGEALDALRADPRLFDLVVTDYNMPGMSGLEVARRVRAIRADLPVAMASGFIDDELRAQAGGAGVRELIFKANATEDLCEAFVRLAQTIQGTSKSS